MPRWFGVLAVMTMLIGAGGAEAAPEARLGCTADPESFDPQLISGNPDFWLANDLFEGLFSWNADGVAVPGMAETWETAPDGKVWTFHLRSDARWSDGTPVTADDFVYSLRRAVSPKAASPYAAALAPIIGVSAVIAGKASADQIGAAAVGPHELKLRLVNPTPYLPTLLALPIAFPVPRVAIEKFGDKWTAPGNLVGNGAFTLESWVPNSEIVLAKSATYRGAATVKLDRVHYVVEDDQKAGVKRYMAGEIDEARLLADDVPWAKRERPAEYVPEPLPSTEHLVVNMTRRPFGSDLKLRQAISLAIDRNALATKVDPRGGAPAWTLVPAGLGGYQPPERSDRDLSMTDRLTRAKALMAEVVAGGAERPTLHLSVYKEDVSHRLVQAVAAMLRQNLGLTVELDEPEWRVWDAEFHRGDFEVALYEWAADYDDPWTFLSSWRSDAAQLNPGGYRNPGYDALLDQAQATTDVSARLDLLRRAETLLLNDAAVIPLEYDVLPYLINPRLGGWHANLYDQHPARFLSVED